MPYPALPPELPPIVTVTAAELSNCASLPESAPTGAVPSPNRSQSAVSNATASSASAAIAGTSNRASSPEAFPPQSSSAAPDKKRLTFPLPPLPSKPLPPTTTGTPTPSSQAPAHQATSASSPQPSRKVTPAHQAVTAKTVPSHKTTPAKSGITGQKAPAPPSAAAKPSSTRPANTGKTAAAIAAPADPQTVPFGEAGLLLPPDPAPPVSCAALLGSTSSTGYLPTKAQTTPGSSRATQPAPPVLTSSLKPIALPERLNPARLQPPPAPAESAPAAAPPRPAPVAPAHSPAYEVSGVSGQLAKLPTKDLMQQLNQGLVFDELAESYTALSTLTEDDLKRFARDRRPSNLQAQAQANPAGTINSPSDTFFPEGRFPVAPLPSTTPSSSTPTPSPEPTETKPVVPPPDNVIEVTADRQDYNERSQIFTAEGKVMIRFQNGLLEADRVQVNMPNRFTVAEGNVALTRGTQVLRGQRFEYNFVQGVGTVQKARGDIFLPTLGTATDFGSTLVPGERPVLAPPISDRITSQQPISNVYSPGGVSFSFGAGRDITRVPGALPRGGQVRRLRFEAQQVDFTPEGWVAQNIDITNDPFSPPELVLRADKAVLTHLTPLTDELVATRPRLVFDQKVSVPFLRRRFILSRAEPEPTYFRFAYDDQDRGGLFVEGIAPIINTPTVNFSIYPQVFLQRMLLGTESNGPGDLDNYGIRTALDVNFTDLTRLRVRAALTSLNFDKFEDKLRASVRLQQFVLPTRYGYHQVSLEYSYRDRLFNGSLGFQTVQTSLGAVFQSPNIILGTSGIGLNYQTGFQVINADTDRADLLKANRTNNRVTLGRFQTTASIGRSFALWTGKPLPATRDEGLNYTPNPVVPQISLATSLRGVFSYYTSGDTQQDLIGTVGLSAQFGHFSKRFFDYTSFGVFYSQVIGSGNSPFLFDRSVDNRILSLSFFQQLYGPLRGGVQTSINLDTNSEISTDIFLEYSRRTHGIIVRYNPVLALGSISFRISDFNWTGTAEPFSGSEVVPVDNGVERR